MYRQTWILKRPWFTTSKSFQENQNNFQKSILARNRMYRYDIIEKPNLHDHSDSIPINGYFIKNT